VLKLIEFMNRVGGGDLEAKAEFGGSTEFRRLADALNRMIADLRDRLRLRHSLGVAMQVQQRLLPAVPPHMRGLDMAGHSTYCDETGGDYYDFLVLDRAAPDAVLVALGDVNEHGLVAFHRDLAMDPQLVQRRPKNGGDRSIGQSGTRVVCSLVGGPGPRSSRRPHRLVRFARNHGPSARPPNP
jgi:hypothetical protein